MTEQDERFGRPPGNGPPHHDDLRDRRLIHAAGHEARGREDILLSLHAGHVIVQVSKHPAPEDEERVLLTLKDERGGSHFAAHLSPLELDVLAYGLNRIAVKVAHDEDRR